MSSLNLDQIPEILQKAVHEFLQERPYAKLLGLESKKFTPYKDKTIISTAFVAYIEDFNLMVTLSFRECSKSEWSDISVNKNAMFADEIKFFIKNGALFKK